jgi:DNA-binding FadR family transcriptional regulator
VTVYRRPDPIPLHRGPPQTDFVLHPVRSEQEDLHRLVSRQIFAAILSGAYAEGSILPNEHALSQELGVSRTALRESVKGLVAKGILNTRRRRGTLVQPRSAWNLFDADVIAWLRRDDDRSVTAQLIETLVVAVSGAAHMAASHRAHGTLAASALCAGKISLETRASFLVELGRASKNAFIASIISTAIRSLSVDDPRQLDAWTSWMTALRAAELTDLIRNGDASGAALFAQRARAQTFAAV